MALAFRQAHMAPMATESMTTDGQEVPSGGIAPAARGFWFALSAYLLWGVLPLFIKLVDHVPAVEIVAHRILWSVPIAAAVLIALGRTADVIKAFGSPRTMAMAALTAALITVNWSIYVWAIAVDRTVETALGYYVNPLMSVVMGAVFLGERLSRAQMAAIGLAAIAVVILTLETGGLPWISLALAASFAVYGFLRKTLPIGPSQGFFLEVLLLAIPSLLYVLWLEVDGTGHFLTGEPLDVFLMLACGPATAVPLLLYGFGAKLLRLSTIGLMQYIAPTMIFLIAVFVFDEPFSSGKAAAFALIWTALAIYSWPMLFGKR
jgi:chloramphenicol-sensitive protein RarD